MVNGINVDIFLHPIEVLKLFESCPVGHDKFIGVRIKLNILGFNTYQILKFPGFITVDQRVFVINL